MKVTRPRPPRRGYTREGKYMPNWVEGILSPLKTASGLVQEAIQVRDTVKFGEVIIGLQAQILAAQQGAMSAAERMRELEAQVASFEAWDAEKQRYQLVDFGGGTFAYQLKQDETRGEPMHRLCPTCFEKRQRSILQSRGQNAFRQDMYECLSCGGHFVFGPRHEPPSRSALPRHR